ncbi:MAG: biopolymer transporter ExbD [Planctomycetaceae bacterium]|jgi:biopolymer transport protein ExbD|nr:biopolymer transporter ExbD [Planctomycetaceae bacterium]
MKRTSVKIRNAELDMTPMIDVIFLLIAFFTLVINFTAADQNERIKLPVSETAQPPEVPPTEPMTLNLLANGNIIYNGSEYTLETLREPLEFQLRVLKYMKVPAEKITVIIRADAVSNSGSVLKLIDFCQSENLTRFILRTIQADK